MMEALIEYAVPFVIILFLIVLMDRCINRHRSSLRGPC